MTPAHALVSGDEPGSIVAGFDVHRREITVDALGIATGEVSRGQIESTPAAVAEWLAVSPHGSCTSRRGMHRLAVRLPSA